MDRIIDDMIEGRTAGDMVRFKQPAYVKGISIDTVLHNMVHFIERSLDENMYTLAICIDIEGAFKNVHIDIVIHSLDQFSVDLAIRSWIGKNLLSRHQQVLQNDINISDGNDIIHRNSYKARSGSCSVTTKDPHGTMLREWIKGERETGCLLTSITPLNCFPLAELLLLSLAGGNSGDNGGIRRSTQWRQGL
ncbi:hypothetical protein EVAR_71836_1 [Eumeta japonica]|uniref:Reverse transcriptase domain-containing protein n=1 Tax=Eumeta variegata TaxID=151549 RepID=A0A4C1SD70_EUMVA|nr:hypothetical protein EVAR_71836_1 [Eumeta japonica]